MKVKDVPEFIAASASGDAREFLMIHRDRLAEIARANTYRFMRRCGIVHMRVEDHNGRTIVDVVIPKEMSMPNGNKSI